jgi:ATP-dependent DNA ligase
VPHRASKAKPSGPKRPRRDRVSEGALNLRELHQKFPRIALPVRPPLPPMEARTADHIPVASGTAPPLYEPKWDGFRCLVFRKGREVLLQSKGEQPLGRYFPELVQAFAELPDEQFVLDGEIVIFAGDGVLDFDALLQRIHPADTRVRRLAAETPATYMAFDILVGPAGQKFAELPLQRRRAELEAFFARLKNGRGSDRIRLSPATCDIATARRWLRELGSAGLDGIIGKRMDAPYLAGDRSAMVKVKRIRTADCIVGGFRYAQKGDAVGSLLLGLYDANGLLHHVGFTSSFSAHQRSELKRIVKPRIAPPGFTGNKPGGPSRWANERSTAWQPLKPELVCEVSFDHFSGNRFRHGTKFLRWRPEKSPKQCTFEQVRPAAGRSLSRILAA